MVGMSKRLTAAAVASWASRRGSANVLSVVGRFVAFAAVVSRRAGRGRRGGVKGTARGVRAVLVARGRFCGGAGAPRSRGDLRAAAVALESPHRALPEQAKRKSMRGKAASSGDARQAENYGFELELEIKDEEILQISGDWQT